MEDIEKEIEKILDRLYSWGYECGINQMMGGAPIYGEDMLSTDEAIGKLNALVEEQVLGGQLVTAKLARDIIFGEDDAEQVVIRVNNLVKALEISAREVGAKHSHPQHLKEGDLDE